MDSPRGVVDVLYGKRRQAAEAEVTAAFKAAFTALMTADAALVAAQVDLLVARLDSQQREKEGGSNPLSDKEALVLRLSTQYPR